MRTSIGSASRLPCTHRPEISVRRALRAFAVASLLLSASGTAQAFQLVHVVNGGSGSALQNAIDAAASGDTVLVHGGTFTAIQIVGKSLTLVSEPSLSTTVQGLRIASTSALQPTTVSGLHVATPAYSGTPLIPDCIVLDQCAGSIRLEGIQAAVAAPNGRPALHANKASDVALLGCTLTGSDGLRTPALAFISPPYGEGVRSTQSNIAAYECTIRGGNGMDGFTQDPCSGFPYVWFNSDGAPGVAADAASVWFSSAGSIIGGAGGDGVPARCSCTTSQLVPGTNGSAGGAGIDNAVGSTTTILATVLTSGAGGAGGLPSFCTGTPAGGGVPGAAGPASTNPLIALNGTPAQLSGPMVIRAGQTLSLTLRGAPGDTALLGLSFETRWSPFYFANGVLHIGPSGRRVPVGVFPASGVLIVNVPTAISIPGAQSSQWHLQAFGYPAGGIQVGAGWEVTVLDPSF